MLHDLLKQDANQQRNRDVRSQVRSLFASIPRTRIDIRILATPFVDDFLLNPQEIVAILINMQVGQKAALITVGTTEFDELLEKIDTPTFADVLLKFGYNKLVIQRGRGNYKFGRLFLREEDEFQAHLQGGLLISVMRFHPDLVEIIHQSDLVIGHAGAGTVLEVAKAKKVSLIVVNPTLQDNHQEELARAIQSIGSDKCMIGHLDDILSPLQILLMNNHNRHAFVQDDIIFPILDSRNFASILSEMVEVDE